MESDGKSIFVSIASYRDSEISSTVESVIENADRPENLHISIVNQCLKKEFISFESIYLKIRMTNRYVPAIEARGAGYARSLAQEAYDGEDFFLQIDSHSRMTPGWDTDLIDMMTETQMWTGRDRIIMSQFPAAYLREGEKEQYIDSHKYPATPSRQEILWTRKGTFSATREPMDLVRPQESETVLAGFIFAPGYIVKEVPYDPEISFFGEELCFAIRAYTRGWRIYSPNKMVIRHFYHRPFHHKIWDSTNNANKKWGVIEKASMMKQAKVYAGVDLGIWGALSYNTLKEYNDFVGLDINDMYQKMLKTRLKLSENWLEQDIIPGNHGLLSERLSIPCLDGEHEDSERPCAVDGCECECHVSVHKPGVEQGFTQ